MDELIGNLKIHDLKKQQEKGRNEPKKEKNLTLKSANRESIEEDEDTAYITRRFQR